MLLFVGHSLRTMTASAVRSVPLDWQGPVASLRSSAERSPPAWRGQPGVLAGSPGRDGAVRRRRPHARPARRRSAPAPARSSPYRRATCDHIHTFRFLRGSLAPGEVVLDQQLAATLQAESATRSRSTPRRAPRRSAFRVSAGSRSSPRPTSLFQPLNPLLGPGARPAAGRTSRSCRSARSRARSRRRCRRSRRRRRRRRGARAPQTASQWQVQAQLDPAALDRQPGARTDAAPNGLRNGVERDAARAGAVRRQPLGHAQHRRRRRALRRDALHHARRPGRAGRTRARLPRRARHGRARPARPRAAARARRVAARPARAGGVRERCSSVCSPGCSAAGIALAGGCDWSCRHGAHLTVTRVAATVGACVALAIAGRAGGAARRRRGCAARARSPRDAASAASSGKPLWQRLYLDVAALAVSGLDLLADGAHRFLGGRQSRLQPDPLAVGVHVLRAGAPLARRGLLLVARCAGAALGWLARRVTSARATSRSPAVPARQRRPARRGDQPRARARRPPARVRRQPRHLRGDLRPAGARRRPADRRRRRRRHRAARRPLALPPARAAHRRACRA